MNKKILFGTYLTLALSLLTVMTTAYADTCLTNSSLKMDESKTYFVDGKDYAVNVDIKALENKPKAQFTVNGEVINYLAEGSSYTLKDGTVLTVSALSWKTASAEKLMQALKIGVPNEDMEKWLEVNTDIVLFCFDGKAGTELDIEKELGLTELALTDWFEIPTSVATQCPEVPEELGGHTVVGYFLHYKGLFDPESHFYGKPHGHLRLEKGYILKLIEINPNENTAGISINDLLTKLSEGQSKIVGGLNIIAKEIGSINGVDYIKFCMYETEETRTKALCTGCNVDSKCFAIGERFIDEKTDEAKYCAGKNLIYTQQPGDKVCMNNYECESNLCIDEKCIALSWWRKVVSWFARIFGMAVKG